MLVQLILDQLGLKVGLAIRLELRCGLVEFEKLPFCFFGRAEFALFLGLETAANHPDFVSIFLASRVLIKVFVGFRSVTKVKKWTLFFDLVFFSLSVSIRSVSELKSTLNFSWLGGSEPTWAA